MTWLHFCFYNCFHNDINSGYLRIKGIEKALFAGEDGFSEPKKAERAIFHPKYR